MARYRQPTGWGSPYITPQGEKSLRDELHQLWKIERPRVTEAVHEAAKNGDRSENGDYIYGKRRLREIDRRVGYLNKRLEQLIVVNQPPTKKDKVYFGAIVTLEDDDGATISYKIVGPDEFDLANGRLSMDSPLAKNLLGKMLDDTITMQQLEKSVNYTITNIHYDIK